MSSTNLQQQEALAVSHARKKFLAMATTYSLGVFNDNFFKQAGGLLAVSMGLKHLQGYAAVLFTLPFILLAAQAGWLADRFPKRNVIIAAKVLEVAAMLIGAMGLWWMNWTLILTMVTLMGVHSTIFSPSLNGSIPELYPASYVTRANAHLKVATTAAILLGNALAGVLLDIRGEALSVPAGRLAVAAAAVVVAAGGLLVAFGCPSRPPADPSAKLPLGGPWRTLKVLWEIRRDRLLAVAIAMDAYVWFLGALQLLLINVLGIVQLGATKTQTSLLVVSEMVGVAAGGILSGRLTMRMPWRKLLLPASIVLGTVLAAMPFAQSAGGLAPAIVLLFLAGASGGLMLIPLESFIQVRPRNEDRGSVIAAGNFAAFVGIMIAGGLFVWLYPAGEELAPLKVVPTSVLAALGAATVLAGSAAAWALKGVRE